MFPPVKVILFAILADTKVLFESLEGRGGEGRGEFRGWKI